ncbi:MAG: RtcB family protein [Sphingobacteriales bacterium]|nr:MAG: RtcB family protein [Sphingobacteriales bacterium]
MSNFKTKELSKLGYTDNIQRSLAINILSKHFKHSDKAALTTLLTNIKNNPQDYVNDTILAPLAGTFTDEETGTKHVTFDLLQQTGQLKIYGGKEVEHSAKKQMEIAMSLPVSVQGALMPDAHTGYGLPIGGVLATRNVVIPYAVGVDIGCRMALSIFDEGDHYLKSHSYQMKMALKNFTHFGMDGGLDFSQEHEVLDSPVFQATDFLKRLQMKAARQIGSSGSGNHFVEFGMIELFENNAFDLPAKAYLALLSHSGSRGLGANVAQHYTRIAQDTCKLPREAQQLAWLDMNSEAGQEYWLSMNLAGDYAKACHERIHANLSKALGLQVLASTGNHHNFAWEEELADGSNAIVHRKGATPAQEGVMGIIPGSMTTAAYLVSGKGVQDALQSAAHGAGRAMSRKRAKEKVTASALKKMLAAADVTLIGGSVEENPTAYKDIERVMAAQQTLVEVQGKFMPKIVRMNRE